MKAKLPTLFDFEGDDVKIVYLVGSDEPLYNATCVAKSLGLKNPSSSALSAVNTLYDKVKRYCEATDKEFVTGMAVEIANSVRKAEILASDGVITVIRVANSKRSVNSQFHYYYNQEALYEVLLSSNCEASLRFRYWITHDVLPSIRKTGEYIMHRKDGIGVRKLLTDSLKRGIEKKKFPSDVYPAVTDAIYYIRFGVHTNTLRDMMRLKDGENIREHLSQEDLIAIGEIENSIAGALNCGMTLEQAVNSDDLIEIYRRSPKI